MKWYVDYGKDIKDKYDVFPGSVWESILAAGLEDLIRFMWCPSDHVHFARNASYRIHENGIAGPVLPFSSVDRLNQSVTDSEQDYD